MDTNALVCSTEELAPSFVSRVEAQAGQQTHTSVESLELSGMLSHHCLHRIKGSCTCHVVWLAVQLPPAMSRACAKLATINILLITLYYYYCCYHYFHFQFAHHPHTGSRQLVDAPGLLLPPWPLCSFRVRWVRDSAIDCMVTHPTSSIKHVRWCCWCGPEPSARRLLIGFRI